MKKIINKTLHFIKENLQLITFCLVFSLISFSLGLIAGTATAKDTVIFTDVKSTIEKPSETTTKENIEKPEEETPTPIEYTPKISPVPEQISGPAAYIAKTVYGEARGLSKTEQAAVVWCILNRVDAYGSDIVSVVTAPSQFHGYSASHPVVGDIYSLVEDVLQRWQNEKNGAVNVGRVLPKEYLYFYGSGGHNHFTTQYRGYAWDWRLESPYVD